MTVAFRSLLGSALLLCAALAATPTTAAVVVMQISGTMGQKYNDLHSPAFDGTITYDTSTLTYQDGASAALYGSISGPFKAGSYDITFNGINYAAALQYVNVYMSPSCDGGFSAVSCLRMDFALKSAIPGHNDGRLWILVKNNAPFNSVNLPAIAPSSSNVYYGFFELPQESIGTRMTAVGVNNGSFTQAGAGASLSFGPAAAVPEPGTWGMMILGFGLVGFGMRSRKARLALA